MIAKPGLTYATLPDGTPVGMQVAVRNITDNLFYLLDQVSQLQAKVNPPVTQGKIVTKAPKSGLYTPLLNNVLNLTSSIAEPCQWMEVISPVPVATVSGRVSVDPTAAGSVKLGISFPIPSNITAAYQCSGVAFCNDVAGQGAAILGDPTNNRAQMEWVTVNTTPKVMYFIFMFRVV